MVVKDTRIVKKAAPERKPLRRVCNSPRSENKLSSKAVEVLIEESKENKPVAIGSSPAPLKVPHYLQPTINSCNQTRVNVKTLASPSVISRVKKSSQSEACKYGSRNVKGNSLLDPDVGKRVKLNGLRSSGSVEKTPVKTDRLKALMVVEKKPLKNNRFIPSGAVEKTPMKISRLKSSMAIEKTPGRASSSKIKVARATCSSRCKHVVKDGDSKVSPRPCCPYAYCSLNHLESEALPSVKQFLASRRRLLRTQKSFKWVGLTPVPKGVEISDDGAEKESGVDTGQGLGADVLELCVEIYVNDTRGNDTFVGGSDSYDNCVGGMNDLGKLSANDPSPIVHESMECDDYDDGHSMVDGSLFGSSASHDDDRIEVLESQFDLSDLEVKADVSMEQLAESEFEKDDNYGLDANVSAYDVEAGYLGECDQTRDTDDHCFILPDATASQSDVDESDLGVHSDDSVKEFAGVEDVKDENHGLDVEASAHDVKASYCCEHNETEDNEDHCFILPDALGSQCNFDESDLRVEADDFMKQFAEVEVVKDDNHGFDVDASDVKADETEDVEDHCSSLPDAMASQSDFDESDLGVNAGDSMTEFAGVEDVKDVSHGLGLEASTHDVEASYCYEHNETEDNEGHCSNLPDALGSQCNFDKSDLRVETVDSMKQFAEVKVVKDDNHGFDVDASDVKGDETEDVEDHCSILPNAMGPQCQFDELDVRVDEDDSMNQSAKAEVVKDDNPGLDVYASVHDVEADETEDGEDQCFIPPTIGGPQGQSDELDLSVEADDSLKRFAEAEVVKDDNHGLDVYSSIHDVETDETEGSDGHCFISPNAQGPRCQFDEVDISVEADDSVKQFAEAEVVKDDNNGLGVYASVHDVEADETEDGEYHCFIPPNVQGPQCQFHELHLRVKADDSMNQYAEAEDANDDNHIDASAYDVEASHCYEYSETEDSESRCFIPPNALGSQCISHPESDGSSLESDSCYEGEMEEERNDFEDTPSGDSELCCFIQVDTFGLESGSNTELDSPPNGSDTEPIASPKQGIEMECANIAGSPLIELDINISGDNLLRQFSEIEDDEGDCKSGIEVIANESEGCNNSSCSDSSDNESHCFIQFGCPETQSTDHTESDSPLGKFFFELTASPEYEVIEDIKTATSGQSGSPFEVSANGLEKQCTECENEVTQRVILSIEYDDCHGTDSELCHPAREEDFTMHCSSHIESDSPVDCRLVVSCSCSSHDAIEDCSNITESSLEGLVAGCESIEGDSHPRECNCISQENVNNHHVADSRLVWRRRNPRTFSDQISEAEKVDLRHQMIEERKAAHEWMLDYALTQVVKKLSPFRQRKVELLVEAFETVTPISECETNDLQHDAIGFTHLRPVQACR